MKIRQMIEGATQEKSQTIREAARRILRDTLETNAPALADLVEAALDVLKDWPLIQCEQLHHEKKDQNHGTDCPVVERLVNAKSRLETAVTKLSEEFQHE